MARLQRLQLFCFQRILAQISKFRHNTILPKYFTNRATFSTASEKRKLETINPRLMSGIQPTGVPHVGNYLGAIQHWKKLQDANRYDDVVITIVDLHSITLLQNPDQLRCNTLDMAASLLACGLDSDRTILFRQSDVSHHAELCWILGCLTTMNKLEHLPQWKEKAVDSTEVPLGLFTYPVLQAADILLYKATDVPVGDDQIKHVELARHLAKQFNNTFGPLFPIPRPIVGEFRRIKSLRKPANKMSKSDKDARARIDLTDSPDEIRDKIRKAVSDFTSTITYDPDGRPGISNLIELHSAFTSLTPDEICEQSLHLDTLAYKNLVADILIEHLKPIRENIIQLRTDPSYLIKRIDAGSERAKQISGPTYESVLKMIGCR